MGIGIYSLYDFIIPGMNTAVEELLSAVRDKHSRSAAIDFGKDIFELYNLKILSVTGLDVLTSIELMKRYDHLKPGDSFHAAVSMNACIHTVLSDDADFDGVEEIERVGLY